MTVRYVVALSIIALLAAATLAVDRWSLAQARHYDTVINVAGRQRMLSQRIALLSHYMWMIPPGDQERVKAREELLDAVDLMERSHNGLIDGDADLNLPGNPSAQVRALLFEPPLRLDAQVRDYLATARSLASASPAEVGALEQQISASAPLLLDALDAAVSQYVRDSDSGEVLRRILDGAALAATLVALVLIGVFLFRPMARRIRRETRALEALTQSLEQKVADRTRVAEQRAEAVERAEGRYRALFEDAPVMYVTTRSEAGIPVVTDCNWAFQRSLGYDREEIVGKPLTNVYTEESRRELESGGYEAALRGAIESERGLVAEDGRVLKTLMRALPELDENGNVVGTRAAFVDVTAQKRSEDQVRAQIQRLEALHDIELSITATLDVRVALGTLLDQLTARLNVDAADVLLLDTSTQRLEYAAGRGFRSSQMRRKAPRLGESCPGRAAMERRTVSVLNLAEYSDPCLDAEWLADEGFAAYHAAPLVAKGEVKGVLEVFHREGQPDDPEWPGFLETLAAQAAVAVDNASLFQDLQRSSVRLSLAYEETLEGWARAMELRDEETEGHTQRAAELTVRIAREMGMTGDELVHVRRGALLHDIGKLSVPDSILLKSGPLTDEEREIMQQHPVHAFEMLAHIAHLRQAMDIPYCHHERWDGSGYPRGLKGHEIPLPARIFAVLDVWDALTSDRPYRAAWPEEQALEHIQAGAGSHFDPEVVEVFLREIQPAPADAG